MKRIVDDYLELKNSRQLPSVLDVLTTIVALSGAVIIAFLFDTLRFSDANLIMVFIFGVVLVSVRTGRFLGIVASVSSVILFNFFFTEPRFTFVVYDTQYLFTFTVMLAVSLISSALTVREKIQAKRAGEREHRANVLFHMSRALLTASGREAICQTALAQIRNAVSGTPRIFLIEGDGIPGEIIYPDSGSSSTAECVQSGWDAALRALEHREPADAETAFPPDKREFSLPLSGTEGNHGVLSISFPDLHAAISDEDASLLGTFAAQISLALDRDRILSRHEEAKVRAENEKLRVTILRSISHDLRTPLAGITGASSTLLTNPEGLGEGTRQELLETIYDEAAWLSDLVENILSLTRVQSSGGVIRKVPEVLDDVLFSAVQRVQKRLQDHVLEVIPPEEVLLVPMDGMLVEQVLINLLDNAVRHTPAGTEITLSTQLNFSGNSRYVEFLVEDTGPGIPESSLPVIFDLFKQIPNSGNRRGRGAGLGLGICRAIVEAHGGSIHAENRREGGARFRFTVPAEEKSQI